MQRRKTKNKERIEGLFSHHHMLSMSEVIKLLPDIDHSIIYRNIKQFVQDGILREVHLIPGVVSYEKNDDKHDHFLCDKCGMVYVIHMDRSHLQRGFPVTVNIYITQATIHGVCHKCRSDSHTQTQGIE